MTRKILLVEDNSDNRVIYRRALEHFGYTVFEALDGEAALRIARESVPDLILMDISIPRLNGWDVTRILLSEEGTRHIPIVALTAHALPQDRARGAELGFARYLTKPIEPRRVIEEIERVMAGRTVSPHAHPETQR